MSMQPRLYENLVIQVHGFLPLRREMAVRQSLTINHLPVCDAKAWLLSIRRQQRRSCGAISIGRRSYTSNACACVVVTTCPSPASVRFTSWCGSTRTISGVSWRGDVPRACRHERRAPVPRGIAQACSAFQRPSVPSYVKLPATACVWSCESSSRLAGCIWTPPGRQQWTRAHRDRNRMRSYIRPMVERMWAPGHHGHLRTKGQSLNRASKANPAIGLVPCRSDRHAMNAFFAEALLGW